MLDDEAAPIWLLLMQRPTFVAMYAKARSLAIFVSVGRFAVIMK